MSAYIIVQITVNDEAAYTRYREDVPGTIKKFGGEYIVRGGDMEVLEGEWRMPRCVVLRFPDMAIAHARKGSIYYQMGDLKQATISWNLALKHDPEYIEVREMLSGIKTEIDKISSNNYNN